MVAWALFTTPERLEIQMVVTRTRFNTYQINVIDREYARAGKRVPAINIRKDIAKQPVPVGLPAYLGINGLIVDQYKGDDKSPESLNVLDNTLLQDQEQDMITELMHMFTTNADFLWEPNTRDAYLLPSSSP
ncbi:hypothetical protein OPQ81_005405 [Rhizoctonia solani]|nr:hypothetical protein OPQ81_005405 [Rhizoctonia solani]